MSDKRIDKVAAELHKDVYKQEWDQVPLEMRQTARLTARTIISAKDCSQNLTQCAMRLATWHWVDTKQDHRPWADVGDTLKKRFMKQAAIGYVVLGDKFDVIESEVPA